MNKNERTNATILSAIVITLLSTMAFVFVGSTDLSQKAIGQAEEIFGENATFIEEIEGTSPTANQTAAPAAPTANQTAAPPLTKPAPRSPVFQQRMKQHQ